MAPKRKKLRLDTSQRRKTHVEIDSTVMKRQQLFYVCGFCEQMLDDNEEERRKHVESHSNEITFCNACCNFVKLDERTEHLKKYHYLSTSQVRFELTSSLVELRISLGKCYSSFWALLCKKTDSFHEHFRMNVKKCSAKYNNARYLGIFRLMDMNLGWNCPLCDTNPLILFKETIGLRAFVLNHYEQFHRQKVEQTMPGFLDFEWHQLSEETDFDVRALMLMANQRLKVNQRGFNTFYTVNLSKLTNGPNFEADLMRRAGYTGDAARFCLICCSLVPKSSVKKHFSNKLHVDFKAVEHSTAFSHIDGDQLEIKLSQENEELPNFRFPEDLFVYTTIFKNVRSDEYKWRCCLCPRAHAITFTTLIIMRMFALRHIDEHHRMLFTDEFLHFEWQALKQEMKAMFDLRRYTPLQYTVRGDNTFNKTNPNDYVLPQQFYFLPKHSIDTTVICGFCYRNFERTEFMMHIVLHGFGAQRKFADLSILEKPSMNPKARTLMGQEVFDEPALEDEPHNVLSIDGKRLKAKMDLLAERAYSAPREYSEVMTPVKSELDGEGYTPRQRKSAMDARRLLSDTFKVLQENVKNMKSTWKNSSESSCSSSSDDSNSEDDRFEETMEQTAMGQRKSNSRESDGSENAGKRNFRRMKPEEIRDLIKEEAERKGVRWEASTSSSSSGDEEEDDGKQRNTRNWATMKLKDIKDLIKREADRQQVTMHTDSSSTSSDSDSD